MINVTMQWRGGGETINNYCNMIKISILIGRRDREPSIICHHNVILPDTLDITKSVIDWWIQISAS